MALISKDKRKWATISNKYGITEKDMIGDLKGFPVGVVVRMLEETEKQGGEPDIKVFQHNKRAYKGMGGFVWDNTEDGNAFWEAVIKEQNFDQFFKKYPEYKKI